MGERWGEGSVMYRREGGVPLCTGEKDRGRGPLFTGVREVEGGSFIYRRERGWGSFMYGRETGGGVLYLRKRERGEGGGTERQSSDH